MFLRALTGIAARVGRRGGITGGAFRHGRYAELDAEGIADEAFNMAFEMCGNEGQVSIIERTTWGAFIEAVVDAIQKYPAHESLYFNCPHPEAVGQILDDCAQFIQDTVEEHENSLEADVGDGDDWNPDWD